ncbi:MAG: terpene cyclase/mutase family protein [Verrucomicrobiae bacterium]|nr:terpene cyclase/mutase family protein [Verrucomicrobiae bacterium]
MTIKAEMLKTAEKAKGVLGDSFNLVIDFVKSRQNPDGGFRGRSAESDLYYSVFANNILNACGVAAGNSMTAFVESQKNNTNADFIHLCSYINLCSALILPDKLSHSEISTLKGLLESFRSADGGYSVHKNSAHGSVYACFLAFSAYENLNSEPPDREKILDCLKNLETPDGGYSNEPNQTHGTTTTTAAAIVLLKKFNHNSLEKPIDWLMKRYHKGGGFIATPSTAIPDLLSTATSLFALKSASFELSSINDSCMDFLDSLWDGNGAFRGHWFDEDVDVEYTFYGLLSIGCLAV